MQAQQEKAGNPVNWKTLSNAQRRLSNENYHWQHDRTSMPFAFLFHDPDLGNDFTMTKEQELEIRNVCLDALDAIYRLQEQVEHQNRKILPLS